MPPEFPREMGESCKEVRRTTLPVQTDPSDRAADSGLDGRRDRMPARRFRVGLAAIASNGDNAALELNRRRQHRRQNLCIFFHLSSMPTPLSGLVLPRVEDETRKKT